MANTTRVLLDTNIWRYLVDADEVNGLHALTKTLGCKVQVAPAVMYETLRTSDPAVRGRLAEAVTRRTWSRLMPEAFDECQAIVDVVRRRRPDWLREDPDLREFHRLRADWAGGGVWSRARRDTAAEARRIRTLEGDVLVKASAEAVRRRAEFEHIPFTKISLAGWAVRASAPVEGWDGTEVEPWRFETADTWWAAINGQLQQAFLDWTEPFLDLHQIRADQRSWNHLWLHEAHVDEVPREWIRWAVRFLQGTRKVTAGTPGDNQLATYLIDTDLFVTADRAFAAIAEKLEDHASFPVGSPRLLRASDAPLRALADALSA